MKSAERLVTLKLSRSLLKSAGLIGVLDWAEPSGTALRWGLHALLATVEPRTAMDWIESDFEIELKQTGFIPIEDHPLAFGAARVVLAEAAILSMTGS